jgi:hypothetical protein
MPVKRLKTPVFLEDIIEWMCKDSWRTLMLETLGVDKCEVQLSQFDQNVVKNITDNGLALTEKQVDLCIKLIKRYKIQIMNQIENIDELIDPYHLKQPIRKIDQTRAIWLEDDHIIVKFPFNQDIINKMKKYSTTSTIRLGEYMPEEKQWRWIPCEHTYYTLGRILEKHDFEVDQKILDLINATLDLKVDHDTLYFVEGKLSSNNKLLNNWLSEQESLEQTLLKVKSNALKYNADSVKDIGDLYKDKWYKKLFANFHQQQFWLDTNKIKKNQLIDFVLDYKLDKVIIKLGNSPHKKELLKLWIYAFQQHERLKNNEVSFLWNDSDGGYLPDDTDKLLDAFISGKKTKEPFLKNKVNENTKFIVMPFRPERNYLVSRVKPMLTLQIGSIYGQDWHERYMLENTHTLVYYSSDGPKSQDVTAIV